MTEKREFYAASVEEAVARAARDLGTEQDALSYRVVDQGNSGFLGIGARDARIEVDATPAANSEEPVVPESVPELPVTEEDTGNEDDTEEESRSVVADIAPEPQ